MKTVKRYQYIYGASKAETLSKHLLTKQQIETLIGTKDASDMRHALYDTFLGQFITDVGDINTAVNEYLKHTKKQLTNMSPDPSIFDILWLRYDFLNIKAIVKGARLGFSRDIIYAEYFSMGTTDPYALIQFALGEGSNIPSYFKNAIIEAQKAETVYESDFIVTQHYFSVLKEKGSRVHEKSIQEFITILIDLYNLRARLRVLSLKNIQLKFEPISGGAIDPKTMQTKEGVLQGFAKCGGEHFWNEAITEYENTGNFTVLETKANRYMVKYFKEHEYGLFSPARAYQYFLSVRNDLQVIRAIYVAKKGQVPIEEIRYMLRR